MLGISAATFYKWKAKFGGMNVSEAQRLRQLEDENAKLKLLVADLSLENVAIKDLLSKNGKAVAFRFSAHCEKTGSGLPTGKARFVTAALGSPGPSTDLLLTLLFASQ